MWKVDIGMEKVDIGKDISYLMVLKAISSGYGEWATLMLVF